MSRILFVCVSLCLDRLVMLFFLHAVPEECTFWKLPFFWRRVYTSESGVIHDPGSHDPDPGPREKSMKKSSVSFETECRYRSCLRFKVILTQGTHMLQCLYKTKVISKAGQGH